MSIPSPPISTVYSSVPHAEIFSSSLHLSTAFEMESRLLEGQNWRLWERAHLEVQKRYFVLKLALRDISGNIEIVRFAVQF